MKKQCHLNESRLQPSSKNDDTQIDMQAFLMKPFFNGFRVATTLIKVGYEPLRPTEFCSPLCLLGWSKPIYLYPNIFVYLYHIMKSMGVWKVLTNGLFANLSHEYIGAIFRGALRRRNLIWNNQKQNITQVMGNSTTTIKTEALLEESTFSVFLKQFSQILSLKFLEVCFKHPFYVIMARQSAALIGNESRYSWFSSATHTIYRENGISGFFQGFLPKIFGELLLISSYYLTCRLLRRALIGCDDPSSSDRMNLIRLALYMTLRKWTYPFEVTSCVMSLHGSELLASKHSNRFNNWLDCKRYLDLNDQSHRGWLPFLRSHVQNQ